MSTMVIIGNVISFIGMVLFTLTGLLKKNKQVLLAQSGTCAIMAVANLILNSWTGCIANLISMVRNILCVKIKFNWTWKIGFILLQLLLSVPFNKIGLVGWMPILASVYFTCVMDTPKETVLKTAIIVCQLCWAVHDLYVQNYVGVVFDLLTCVTSAISIIMLKKQQNQKAA